MPHECLLEIGVEDIPPHAVDALCEQLQVQLKEGLEEHRLSHDRVTVYCAPRRLVAWVQGLPKVQPSRSLEVKGPPKRAAFDAQGKPTKAAEGFCKGRGGAVADAYLKAVDGGEYLFLTVHETGGPTAEVLARLLPQALGHLAPPETMRWGGPVRFVRPVRWLLALFDETVVAFEWAGVISSNASWGHRFAAPQRLTVSSPADYFAQMADHFVMVNHDTRRAHILAQLGEAAGTQGATCDPAPRFLHQLVHSAEHPSAVAGHFDERFLTLPAEVLSTTMVNHQRFVPCYDAKTGEILPHFVGFRDGRAEHSERVRRGYEWVLEARLVDSEFFFVEDRKRSLAEHVPDLKGVIYQAKLGSVWDKVSRLRALAHAVGARLGLSPNKQDALDRAAFLCKADLVTLMVGEFPELQGVMGRVYAALDGEKAPVAQAIGEHYLPQGPEDPLPESAFGGLLSLVDKLDTVAGAFWAGQKPTGSRDPFGLRRAANAVVRLVLQRELELDVFELLRDQVALYDTVEGGGGLAEVEAFFCERLQQVLRHEFGVAYDVAEAVVAPSDGHFLNVMRKARSLEALRGMPAFVSLVQTFSRAHNLLAKRAEETPSSYDPKRFVEPAESDLWRALLKAESQIEKRMVKQDFPGVLETLSGLRPAIDRYFSEVMVMAEDDALRKNRLGLLGAIRSRFLLVGDLSKVVVEGATGG